MNNKNMKLLTEVELNDKYKEHSAEDILKLINESDLLIRNEISKKVELTNALRLKDDRVYKEYINNLLNNNRQVINKLITDIEILKPKSSESNKK